MRMFAPFTYAELLAIDECFLSAAERVVAMEDVVAGDRAPNVIGLRHDCDSGQSLKTATEMARWEAERGYRATYFMLHTAPYWNYTWFEAALEDIAMAGHEIGIHVDALGESLVTGEDPDVILARAIERLRGFGYPVRGAVGHGNGICLKYRAEHESPFANDEQFSECRRPEHGDADRIIARGNVSRQLAPRPLADFGLEYEALRCALPWSWRFSDSGGGWLAPGFEKTAERFAQQVDVAELPSASNSPRQLHLLIHPDWWLGAFARVAA